MSKFFATLCFIVLHKFRSALLTLLAQLFRKKKEISRALVTGRGKWVSIRNACAIRHSCRICGKSSYTFSSMQRGKTIPRNLVPPVMLCQLRLFTEKSGVS